MNSRQETVSTLRRSPERTLSPRPWARSSNPGTEAEALLCDIAVALRATRAIKAAMMGRQPCQATKN